MTHRKEIIDSLTESVIGNDVSELDIAKKAMSLAKKAAPVVALALPIVLALRKKKGPIVASARQAIQLAMDLQKARNNKDAAIAAASLLNIITQTFASIPELRDLAHKLNQVLTSRQLMEYFL